MIEFTSRARFIKICGITSVNDALVVRDSGADALGVNFATSKRHVEVDVARDVVGATVGTLHVGVFKDNDTGFVLEMVDEGGVEIVQIHGPLDMDLLEQLRARGRGIIKALSIGAPEFFTFDETLVDAVMIDGLEPGSGLEHSWDEMRSRHFKVPVIAAGGLTSENIDGVISLVRPWGVDVATGVESSPGRKDAARVTTFVQVAAVSLGRGGST